MLVIGNFVATLVTNPIDVVLSKMLTQHPNDVNKVKYKGLIASLKTVYAEEGVWKFASGLHPRFMFNLFGAFMYLFMYNRFIETVNKLNL